MVVVRISQQWSDDRVASNVHCRGLVLLDQHTFVKLLLRRLINEVINKMFVMQTNMIYPEVSKVR